MLWSWLEKSAATPCVRPCSYRARGSPPAPRGSQEGDCVFSSGIAAPPHLFAAVLLFPWGPFTQMKGSAKGIPSHPSTSVLCLRLEKSAATPRVRPRSYRTRGSPLAPRGPHLTSSPRSSAAVPGPSSPLSMSSDRGGRPFPSHLASRGERRSAARPDHPEPRAGWRLMPETLGISAQPNLVSGRLQGRQYSANQWWAASGARIARPLRLPC
ncbi:hypothetical protein NDU88_005967 [Pleurodeles waltl]|uniref:Uncharacterized protein n=1 Tax=Pleurodeles waltl TaxID=8319 RepID=A0AAV7TWX3_PLEWA|nr:hypothetical protein NDU88_005967 [Pleurodeles waltl]